MQISEAGFVNTTHDMLKSRRVEVPNENGVVNGDKAQDLALDCLENAETECTNSLPNYEEGDIDMDQRLDKACNFIIRAGCSDCVPNANM
ncbi:hypothetical protein JHK87_016141 [Glycine soja]|nr:hypothetical protein JHK87_016141 [Glycine soja]